MSYCTTPALTFSAADLTALDALAQSFERPMTVEVCADDGPAWAALVPVERRGGPLAGRNTLPSTDRREGFGEVPGGPLMSVQTTSQPGRRLVVLAADGRTVLGAGDDLADLVRMAGLAAH